MSIPNTLASLCSRGTGLSLTGRKPRRQVLSCRGPYMFAAIVDLGHMLFGNLYRKQCEASSDCSL